jgi:predicted nucleic acid-binding protein
VDAIDTGILIWGIRKMPDPDRPDLVERCEKLIDRLSENRQRVMVPSIAVAEYLMGFDDDGLKKAQREIFEKRLFVASFDAKAAIIAAELYDKEVIDKLRNETGEKKQCLKADVKIIATAIAHGGTRIYSNDSQFKSLARGRITVSDIPRLPPVQHGLLDGLDS